MEKKIQDSIRKKNEEAEAIVKSRFKEEKKILASYNQQLQLADFTDLSSVKKLDFLIKAGQSSTGWKIIFMFGFKIPSEKHFVENSQLLFISQMDEIVSSSKYILVYFNNGVSSLETKPIKFLKKTYESLPSKYYLNLVNLYIVAPNIGLKSKLFIGFDFITSFLKLKLVYLEDLDNLEGQVFFRTEFYKKIPDFVFKNSSKKSDSLQLYKEIERKGDEHNTHEEGNKNKRILIIGRNLQDFALSDFGIPYAMIALTAYFDFNNEAINTEGIFRKPGALSEEERLEEYLENQNYGNIFSIKNPIVVGGVFKKIFAKMPEPLFPYNVYEKMKEFNNVDEKKRIEFLKAVVALMPNINKNVLYFLLKFFDKVIEHQTYNKMNSYNLAVCFSPCLLKPQNYGIDDLLTNTAIMVAALKFIIEKHKEIFADQLEQKTIPMNMQILKSKTFLIEEWKTAEEEKSNEILSKMMIKTPTMDKSYKK